MKNRPFHQAMTHPPERGQNDKIVMRRSCSVHSDAVQWHGPDFESQQIALKEEPP
jgi:hypothetical protein